MGAGGTARALQAAILIAMVVLAGGTTPQALGEEGASAAAPRLVEVTDAVLASAGPSVFLDGVVRAARRARLGSGVVGTLQARPVELGGRFEAGDLLARVGNPSLEPTLAAALAEVDRLESKVARQSDDLERLERLRKRDLVASEEVDRARSDLAVLAAGLRAAEAHLSEARLAVEEAHVVAPYSGVVTAVHFEVGEFVPAGQPILEISGLENFEVVVTVPEQFLVRLRPGASVSATLPIAGIAALQGRIRQVASASGDGLFPVTVELASHEALRAGMTARIRFRLPGPPRIAVPLRAVKGNPGGRAQVFRLSRSGVVEAVEVDVVGIRDGLAVVVGDLAAGDPVAVDGSHRLRHGDLVESR